MADRPDERGTATMKLTTNTNVSLDGVMQGLGGPEEDRGGRFEHGTLAIRPQAASGAATRFARRNFHLRRQVISLSRTGGTEPK